MTSGSMTLQPRVTGDIINQITSTNCAFFTKRRKGQSTVIQRKSHLLYQPSHTEQCECRYRISKNVTQPQSVPA